MPLRRIRFGLSVQSQWQQPAFSRSSASDIVRGHRFVCGRLDGREDLVGFQGSAGVCGGAGRRRG